jgi:hypothetical protein
MAAICSSEKSVLTWTKQRNISDDSIHHSHRRENFIALTGLALQRRGKVSHVRYELDFHMSEDRILQSPNTSNLTSVIFVYFSVGYEDLKQRYLQFSVYDFDRFSRHDLIGHVVLKGLLDSTDLHQELEFTMNVLCAPQVSRDFHVITFNIIRLPRVVSWNNIQKMQPINKLSNMWTVGLIYCHNKTELQ